MVLVSVNQRIWAAEHVREGWIASWTVCRKEEDVKDAISRLSSFGLNPKDFQVACFSLHREVGCEPDTIRPFLGDFDPGIIGKMQRD